MKHLRLTRLILIPIAALAAVLCLAPLPAAEPVFSFCTAGDMRSFTENPQSDGRRFFDGVCEAMQRVGPGEFLLSPGDFDPPAANRAIIDRYLGPKFLWYVIVGNHEVENAAVMPWVREWQAGDIPHVVRRGLPGTQLTLYSWEIGNSHFVAIDSYPWAKAGAIDERDKTKTTGNKGKVDLTDATFQWIEDDLAAARKPFLWVVGHQPIESLPDMDSGRVRHEGESVSYDAERAARFAELLKKFHVRAYLCGHTHNTSVVKLKSGVWQADSGHARGGGDTGSPSSFLKIRIVGDQPFVDIYRADPKGVDYTLRKTVELN
jgi:3',5'-cyclic AMP phosphodiesterase CpdA